MRNPFRYRGYYYDVDSGWYYLQTRYYNPTWGRFINLDSYSVIMASPNDLTDKNLYAYCDNNPITRVDNGGEFWNVIAGAVIGALVNVGVSFISAAIAGDEYTLKDAFVDAVSGAVIGGFAATGLGVVAQTAVGAFVGAGSSVLSNAIHGEEPNVTRAINSAAIGAISGYIGGPGIRKDPVFAGAKSVFRNKLTKAVLPAVTKTLTTFAKTSFLSAMGMRVYDRINEK